MTTPIEKAQRTIARALSELESETEGYVKAVNILDAEITTMNSARRIHKRRVEIDLNPKPGSNWSV